MGKTSAAIKHVELMRYRTPARKRKRMLTTKSGEPLVYALEIILEKKANAKKLFEKVRARIREANLSIKAMLVKPSKAMLVKPSPRFLGSPSLFLERAEKANELQVHEMLSKTGVELTQPENKSRKPKAH